LDFLDLSKIDWALSAGEADIVNLNLLPAGELGGPASFEAELGDEVSEEFIENAFGSIEGLRDIAVGV
jgi:hypothetical protein